MYKSYMQKKKKPQRAISIAFPVSYARKQCWVITGDNERRCLTTKREVWANVVDQSGLVSYALVPPSETLGGLSSG